MPATAWTGAKCTVPTKTRCLERDREALRDDILLFTRDRNGEGQANWQQELMHCGCGRGCGCNTLSFECCFCKVMLTPVATFAVRPVGCC